jgi:prophage antirepressor-like protein
VIDIELGETMTTRPTRKPAALEAASMSKAISPKTFLFNSNEIRVVMIDGEPWWVASDLARSLGRRDADNVTRGLDDDERSKTLVMTAGGRQLMTIVSEPGLYRLVMRSRTTPAKLFIRWLTRNVLPQLRRSGSLNIEIDAVGVSLARGLARVSAA